MPLSDATKGRIPLSLKGEFLLPPLGDWKISPPLLCQELRRGLTLNRYMETDAADITPAGRQPNRSKKGRAAFLSDATECYSCRVRSGVAPVRTAAAQSLSQLLQPHLSWNSWLIFNRNRPPGQILANFGYRYRTISRFRMPRWRPQKSTKARPSLG